MPPSFRALNVPTYPPAHPPSLRNGHFPFPPPPRVLPILRNADDWTKWVEITVKIRGIPEWTRTLDLYELLHDEGNISKIDLIEDKKGKNTGEALVSFSPPPTRAFWHLDSWEITRNDEQKQRWPLFLELCPKKRTFKHESPLDSGKHYPERMYLKVKSIEFGVTTGPRTMMTMQKIESTPFRTTSFLLDLLRREITITFPVIGTNHEDNEDDTSFDQVKFQISIQQMREMYQSELEKSDIVLLFSLDYPPAFFRKLRDVNATHDEGRYWSESQGWARQTRIRTGKYAPRRSPISLKPDDVFVDIGRWKTYALVFESQETKKQSYASILEALQDYNVSLIQPTPFQRIPPKENMIWDWLSDSELLNTQSFLKNMTCEMYHVPWPVRYQLEVCISQGCLNEHNVSKEFMKRLSETSELEALARLELVTERQHRVFEPMEIFDLEIPNQSSNRNIPKHCIVQRTAIVTPSTIYFATPSVDMSNRILRQYQEHSDRFLRVRFSGEKPEGRIHSSMDDSRDAIFTRIFQCLMNGIQIGDRHYEFLAMGNSQFREHGAYFFASTPTISAATIRSNMGSFDNIKVISKYASRIGQCFSTTHAIRGTTVKTIETQDVERNGFCFTDGVGMISLFLAKLIASELRLPSASFDPPSAFQFRMGGTKGVVAISPHIAGNEVHIRKSQYKFAAPNEVLEIIRWSSYNTPRLNRQLILVLKSLGIPDDVFLCKLEGELKRLKLAEQNEDIALSLLQRQVDFNCGTLIIADILLGGFIEAKDPFAMSILGLWIAWSTKQLKDKAGIPLQQGAFLLGCTDETSTLNGYFSDAIRKADGSYKQKVNALPEIFVQVTDMDKPGSYKVIEGVCIVARNPSLHPGDIRVVRAVNVRDLHHLKNVIVFPQSGDRDLPNMCSGGDLDGDDFLVVWDPQLIPPVSQWDNPAMDFDSPPSRTVSDVTVRDIASFFVNYMKTDNLGSIATWHLANADWLDDGVRHPYCLELAKQHSIAVDYAKSGVPPSAHPKLRPQRYPHFLPNLHRPKEQIYKSSGILGQLYDRVPHAEFKPPDCFAFDERVLRAYTHSEERLATVSKLKAEYDAAMRRIMAQYEINTEFEVWTTLVLQHGKLTKDYKFHEEIGRISTALKDQFVQICRENAGGKDFNAIAPFAAAMYTVTAQEAARAQKPTVEPRDFDAPSGVTLVNRAKSSPLISFPWLFHRQLVKIAQSGSAPMSSDISDEFFKRPRVFEGHSDEIVPHSLVVENLNRCPSNLNNGERAEVANVNDMDEINIKNANASNDCEPISSYTTSSLRAASEEDLIDLFDADDDRQNQEYNGSDTANRSHNEIRQEDDLCDAMGALRLRELTRADNIGEQSMLACNNEDREIVREENNEDAQIIVPTIESVTSGLDQLSQILES